MSALERQASIRRHKLPIGTPFTNVGFGATNDRVYYRVRDIAQAESIGDLSLKGFPDAVRTYNILTVSER
jgi:hypothetical protein